MKSLATHAVFLSTVFSANAARALEMNFKDAEARMLAQSLELKQKAQELEVAEANLKLAYAARLPTVSANWTHQKRGEASWSSGYSLDAEMSLFAGGAEYSAIAALKARRRASELALEDYRDALRVRLAGIMLAGSLATGKIEILKKTQKTIDNRVNEQRRRLRLGQVREPDLLQTEMESLRLGRTTISLEQELLQAGSDLKSLLGMSSGEAVVFAPLEKLAAEITAQLKPRAEYQLEALRQEHRGLEYDARSTWRSHLPTLGAFAGYGNAGTSGGTGRDAQFNMGLRAEWVFFQGFALPAEMRRANAQARVLEEKIKQATLDREIQTELKRSEIKTYVDRHDSVKRASEMARKAFQVQQTDYRRGIVTELEVLSSIQNYLELQTEDLDLVNQITRTRVSGLEVGAKL